MSDKKVSLNCDLGESYSVYKLCDESLIIPYVDQANIACGFHAGDPNTILSSLNLCAENDVVVGAHPSYPDRQGFGRRSMSMNPAELKALLYYQLSAIKGLAEISGCKLAYVKPHGALYNDMMKNADILNSVLSAIRFFSSDLKLMILATPDYQVHQSYAADAGVDLLFEAFADRRYTEQGMLRPRSFKDAVLPFNEAREQAKRFVQHKAPFPVDSICVHGDTPEALSLVKYIRECIDNINLEANSGNLSK